MLYVTYGIEGIGVDYVADSFSDLGKPFLHGVHLKTAHVLEEETTYFFSNSTKQWILSSYDVDIPELEKIKNYVAHERAKILLEGICGTN